MYYMPIKLPLNSLPKSYYQLFYCVFIVYLRVKKTRPMPAHSPEGDRTKRYEKIDFLGEGQFATVYKAKDTQDDDKIVAGNALRNLLR